MSTIDEKRNVLFWIDEVNEEMHSYILAGLNQLNSNRRKTITLVMSTPGGDAHTALAIYDLIKNNPKPVRIIVNGRANSSGSLILQAGARRLASEHSHLLIHFGSQGGTSHAEMDFDRRIHAKWVELMAAGAKGKTSPHDMDILHRGETYLTAQEALLHGLIDGITNKILG